MGLPLALGMSTHVLFNLADLLLIGRLVGDDAVAAAHVATTFNFLPMIVGNGVSVVVLAALTRHLGAGEVNRAQALSTWSQGFMVALGVVLGLGAAALTGPCVDGMGLQGAVRDDAFEYLLVTNLGTVTMFVLMQTTTSMRACGEVVWPLGLLLGANALNVALDYVFLAGWPALGLSPMGVAGAAYATVWSRLLFAAIGLARLARRTHPLHLRRGLVRDPRDDAWRILGNSVPQGLQMVVRVGVLLVLTRVAQDLGGVDALAAIGVTTRLDSMVLFAAVGYASAATTLGGRAFGMGDSQRLRAIAWWAGLQALMVGAVMVACFALCVRPLVDLFLGAAATPEIHRNAATYFWWAGWGHPTGALALAVGGAIHGTGRMWSPVVLDTLGYGCLLMPALAWAASGRTADAVGADGGGWGLEAPWLVFSTISAVIAASYLAHVRWGRWART